MSAHGIERASPATWEAATPGDVPVPDDRARAAAIVYRHGRSPLDYFKLWPDKSYFFSPSAASVIAYRIALSVAVSLGDPVGPADELPDLVASFVGSCARHRRRTAFHQLGPSSCSRISNNSSMCGRSGKGYRDI